MTIGRVNATANQSISENILTSSSDVSVKLVTSTSSSDFL